MKTYLMLTIFFAALAVYSLVAAGLPACATEDSDNCVWDATSHGNGHGRSFIVVNGKVTYTK